MARAVVFILLLIALLPARSYAQERFSNPTAGVSVMAPAGWSVVSMQDVIADVSDAEFATALSTIDIQPR